jgi:hypothetical protein
LELDREDFISYRNQPYLSPELTGTPGKQKARHNHNHLGSVIVEWKTRGYFKPCFVRPSSTMTLSHPNTSSTAIKKTASRGKPKIFTLNNYMTYSFSTSVPKKYFSRPKAKNIDDWGEDSETVRYKGKMKSTSSKLKVKTEEIAIGLNIFRGKMRRKKAENMDYLCYF